MAKIGDNTWMRQSFLLPPRAIAERDYIRRTYTSGVAKFSDTTLGGNQAINPLPQFTKWADIKEDRFHKVGKGMGRAYSEYYDDTAIFVNMRFGVPMFNSMTQFFGNFYNSDAARLVNTGRGTSVFYTLGKLAGSVAMLRLMPVLTVWQFFDFLFDNQRTKYIYLKPTMHIYREQVSSILNTISANLGFAAGMSTAEATEMTPIGNRTDWAKLLPDIYNSNGTINFNNVLSRFQRMANRRYEAMQNIRENATEPWELTSKLYQLYQNGDYYRDPGMTYQSLDDLDNRYFNLTQYSEQAPNSTVSATPSSDSSGGEAGTPPTQFESELSTNILSTPAETATDFFGPSGEPDYTMKEYLMAELRDGTQFVTFRVDNPGSVSESFRNTVKPIGLEGFMNNASSSARDFKANFANGNLIGGPLGKMIGSVTDAATSFLQGGLDSVGMSGLAALFGNAMVDVGQMWDSSISELPKINFTMKLRAPYGNDLSRFQSLYVPLACILAGALPRSTGFSSYSFPFYAELYCQGRFQSRNCMIDSLTISRGEGNVGFNSTHKPLGIDVSFSVVDLSSVMHMPMNAAFKPWDLLTPGGLSKVLFFNDSTFNDYMASLSSLGLVDQIYTTRKLKRNFYTAILNFNSWTAAETRLNWLMNSSFFFGHPPGRYLSGIAAATDRN